MPGITPAKTLIRHLDNVKAEHTVSAWVDPKVMNARISVRVEIPQNPRTPEAEVKAKRLLQLAGKLEKRGYFVNTTQREVGETPGTTPKVTTAFTATQSVTLKSVPKEYTFQGALNDRKKIIELLELANY